MHHDALVGKVRLAYLKFPISKSYLYSGDARKIEFECKSPTNSWKDLISECFF